MFHRKRDEAPADAKFMAEMLACSKKGKNGKKAHLNGDTQEDASEFLDRLKYRLEKEEMIRVGQDRHEGTEVYKLFNGLQKQTVSHFRMVLQVVLADKCKTTCSACGHESLSSSPVRSLLLELPARERTHELRVAIDQYFKTERIDGYKCEECHKQTLATKKMQLADLPRYLTLSINRGRIVVNKHGDLVQAKNHCKVRIPVSTVDLAHLCVPSCTGSMEYRVRGVVAHEGRS